VLLTPRISFAAPPTPNRVGVAQMAWVRVVVDVVWLLVDVGDTDRSRDALHAPPMSSNVTRPAVPFIPLRHRSETRRSTRADCPRARCSASAEQLWGPPAASGGAGGRVTQALDASFFRFGGVRRLGSTRQSGARKRTR
jgi:hypothetical protein